MKTSPPESRRLLVVLTSDLQVSDSDMSIASVPVTEYAIEFRFDSKAQQPRVCSLYFQHGEAPLPPPRYGWRAIACLLS
jgi:hypothetical protein